MLTDSELDRLLDRLRRAPERHLAPPPGASHVLDPKTSPSTTDRGTDTDYLGRPIPLSSHQKIPPSQIWPDLRRLNVPDRPAKTASFLHPKGLP
ncbi:hypothetical protein SGLAU_32175 [Streptomyces glaucescens]|uniref:Uncharacterized protein n=1 Tax=Streptomyces glaucescens TaxID=1907 RepID=A0A089XGH0_STRGA|nr:hypothetical protein SGLAU_32175 [Streptomyces glaucescens]